MTPGEDGRERRDPFFARHPVPLSGLLVSPLVFADGLTDADPALASGVPSDVLTGLAAWVGTRPGTIRTAMSRLRAGGQVAVATDAAGVTRYCLARAPQSIARTVQRRDAATGEVVLALLDTPGRGGPSRDAVRETLYQHGFVKLAANVYAGGQVDHDELRALLGGPAGAVHLVTLAEPLDGGLVARLRDLFRVEDRTALLHRLRHDIEAFVELPGLPPLEVARRICYVGPALYGESWLDAPPAPAALLAEDERAETLVRWWDGVVRARVELVAAYLAGTLHE